MRSIHTDLRAAQLPYPAAVPPRHSPKTGFGIFVIHKIAVGILRGNSPALPHRAAVILSVFQHGDAFSTEKTLFPPYRFRRHVYHDPVAHRRADRADAQNQIPRRTDMDCVLMKKFPECGGGERHIAPARREQSVAQRQILGVLQNFINAAPGLDGAGNCQIAVPL